MSTELEVKVICFDGDEKHFIVVSPEKSMHTKGYARAILKALAQIETIGNIGNIKEVHSDIFVLKRKTNTDDFKYLAFIGNVKVKRIIESINNKY